MLTETKDPLRFRISRDMVHAFAELTGDHSSLHVDPEYGEECMFGQNIVHGMLPLGFLFFLNPNFSLHRLSARFAKPVFINDLLTLELTTSTPSAQDNLLDAEFSFREDRSSAIVTTGNLVLAPGTTAPMISRSHALTVSRSPIPIVPLQQQTLELAQIQKGDTAEFAFHITAAHALALEQFLVEGLLDGAPAHALALSRSHAPPNFLSLCMISTFVGMSIPGKHAMLLNFQAAFQRSLELDHDYRFRAEVIFKSTSTATLLKNFVISDPAAGHDVLAAGKINSLVRKHPHSAPLASIAEREAARVKG
jgi:acyl dehydratase